MILVAIDATHKQARMLSVPRDLLVTIPGYGPNHRINEAYTIGENNHLAGGGPALAVKTMEQLTGIHIPYYAVTTFDGFRQTVDALGGVYVDVERPLTDHDYPGQGNDFMPIYVPAGRQALDGERVRWSTFARGTTTRSAISAATSGSSGSSTRCRRRCSSPSG